MEVFSNGKCLLKFFSAYWNYPLLLPRFKEHTKTHREPKTHGKACTYRHVSFTLRTEWLQIEKSWGKKKKDNLKNKDVKKKRELIFKMNLQCTCKQGYCLLRKDIWGLNWDRTKEIFPVITFLGVHFSPEFSTLSQHTDSYTAWDFWGENKALPKVTCRTRVRAYVKGKRGIRTLQLYNTQTVLQKGAGTSVTLACSVWQRK